MRPSINKWPYPHARMLHGRDKPAGVYRCSPTHEGVLDCAPRQDGLATAVVWLRGAHEAEERPARLGDVRWSTARELGAAQRQWQIRRYMRNGGADVSLAVFIS